MENTIVRNASADIPNKVVITDAPKITAISPVEGPETGGTKVVISGSNFKQGSTVTFDGAPASSVVIESDSRITAVSPAHIPSTVDVAVQNPAGYSDTLLRGFSYIKTGVDISIGNVNANIGNLFEVPINISNVAGLIAADFKVNYDKDLLSFQGARIGNITTGFALSINKNIEGIAQLSMASSNSVNGSGIMAYLQFKVLNSTKTTSELTLQDVVLNSGNITVDKTDGTFTVSKTHSVNGTINYYSNSKPVSDFNLTLTGDNPSNTYTSSTGENGSYSITAIPDGNYVLKSTKSNGVSDITAYDASLILQASAGTLTLNANQRIAADVNKDGKIDSMDASYVLQKAAGLININSPFPGAGKVWTTVEGDKTYLGLNSDLNYQNLTAILIGDVSGNWGSSNDPVVQSISKANFSIGTITKEIDGSTYAPVMVTITDGNIFASDLIINYDKNAATVLSVEITDLTNNFALAFNTSTPGVIRISSAGAMPISTSGMLFRIKFNSTSDKVLEATTNIISASVNENAIQSIINGSADINNDKVIDLIDLTKLTPNYNKSKIDEGWNDSLDINKDGVVDIFDFIFISKKKNK